jgi:hypothetical protein
LSAYLSSIGEIPPTVTNHHGIASAFIEGRLLLLTTTSLLSYRFIGLLVIILTAILIYKIIALKLGKITALSFSLLWLSSNPSWMASIKQTPTGIQSVWPNLWIQLLTLTVLSILLHNRKILLVNQVVIGIALASLPFFRIQGFTILIVLFAYILIEFRKYLPIILTTSSLTTFAWLILIYVNGGLNLYVENILLSPLSKADYAEFISFNSIFFNFANKFKYYLVVLVVFLLLISGTSLIKSIVKTKIGPLHHLLVFSALFLFLLGLTLKNSQIWVDTFYIHATALFIDLSIPAAAIYLLLIAKRYIFKSDKLYDRDQNSTILLAVLVIVNILNQFPLSDRGHKWWSAAPSVILLAYLSHINLRNKNGKDKLNLRRIFSALLIASISLSMVEGRVFQEIDRKKIENYKFAEFNGIDYPEIDTELVQNLLKSVEILSQLEAKRIDVSYVCDDGLYYMRSGAVSPLAYSGLAKNTEFMIPEIDSIAFICHSKRRIHSNLNNLNNLNIYTIGRENTDLFIVDEKSELNLVLKNLIE